MIIETTNHRYEVRESDQVYRLVGFDPQTGVPTPGRWRPYDRMSPVRAGEPIRFFVAGEDNGRVLSYQLITTSPVTNVVAA